jgi:hypothetical protein
MTGDEPRPKAPTRARRWRPASTSSGSTYRFGLRLIGIPVAAVAVMLIYTAIRDRMVLPECDSSRARQTLANVFGQLDVKPERYEPLTTVSSSKTEVACKAALPLADGFTLMVDYSFFWEGSKANMKYSISRRPPASPPGDISPHG